MRTNTAALDAKLKRLEAMAAAAVAARTSSKVVHDFNDTTFPKQTAFVFDESPWVVGFTPARAGKSYGTGLKLIRKALKIPDRKVLYLAKTRMSAKNIMWDDVLKTINKRMKLSATWNDTELRMTLPNASSVQLLGADATEQEKDKILGQKFAMVVIDEAEAFRSDLKNLIFKVLVERISDYRDGQIVMIGTPHDICAGIFFDVTTQQEHKDSEGQTWSFHQWMHDDNPYIRDQIAAKKAELIAANPLVIQTSWWKSQYEGIWCVDEANLVYPGFGLVHNTFDELPDSAYAPYHFVLGVDLGYEDDSAFVVQAFQEPGAGTDPTLYTLESWKKSKMDLTSVANRIKFYQRKFSIDIVIVDGANKQGLMEMRNRHSLALTIAEKTAKRDYIQLMNDDYIQRRIKIHKTNAASLAQEYALLVKDESAPTGEDDRCPNHLCDAALYSWRYCYPYLAEVKAIPVQTGTPEWVAQEERKMMEAALASSGPNQQNDMGWNTDMPTTPDAAGWDWR